MMLRLLSVCSWIVPVIFESEKERRYTGDHEGSDIEVKVRLRGHGASSKNAGPVTGRHSRFGA